MKKDFLERTIDFSKKKWGIIFLILSSILFVSLFFQQTIKLYLQIDFLEVLIFMGAIIFFVFGTALMSMSFGEKNVQGEAELHKYGKSKYKYGTVTTKGKFFLLFTLGFVPIFLFFLPYFFIGEFYYEIFYIYFIFLGPIFFIIFGKILIEIKKYLGKS